MKPLIIIAACIALACIFKGIEYLSTKSKMKKETVVSGAEIIDYYSKLAD